MFIWNIIEQNIIHRHGHIFKNCIRNSRLYHFDTMIISHTYTATAMFDVFIYFMSTQSNILRSDIEFDAYEIIEL